MADTDVTIAQRVLEESGRTERQLPLPRIIAMIPKALSALSFSVGQATTKDENGRTVPDRTRRQLLRRTFDTVVITAGTGSLTPLLSAARPPILELNKSWDVYGTDIDGKIQMVTDRTAGENDKPPGFGYGWIEGTTLHINDGSGTDYAGTLTIVGNFLATIPDLYGELDDNLIRILIERTGGANAPEPAEAEARR